MFKDFFTGGNDVIRITTEFSYIDSLGCPVLLQTVSLSVPVNRHTKKDNLLLLIEKAAMDFERNSISLQRCFSDKVPLKTHEWQKELWYVKSNRKFWNYNVIGAWGAQTVHGKMLQDHINDISKEQK